MTLAHLHLLVNHFPIVGTILVLPILVLALWRGGRGLVTAAGLVLVVSGVTGGVAYFTGEDAEAAVEDLPGVDEHVIREHQDRAEIAIVLVGTAGLVGLAGLVRSLRGDKEPGRAWAVAMLVPTFAAAVALVATGAEGGEIRRPELRDPSGAAGSTR